MSNEQQECRQIVLPDVPSEVTDARGPIWARIFDWYYNKGRNDGPRGASRADGIDSAIISAMRDYATEAVRQDRASRPVEAVEPPLGRAKTAIDFDETLQLDDPRIPELCREKYRSQLGDWPAPREFCPRAAAWAMAWLSKPDASAEAAQVAMRFQNRLGSCREMLGSDKCEEALWDDCQRVIDAAKEPRHG